MQKRYQHSFGDLLRTYRRQQGLTQQQLAGKLSLHHNTIGAWERGDYLPATRGMILELARCLRLDEERTRHLLAASLIVVTSHWSVPYQRNPFFTARQDVLAHLHTQLAEGHAACALSGLGGIGKTQTAIEYAYRSALNYAAIFWVNAQTRDDLYTSFAAIASTLSLLSLYPDRRQDVVAQVLNWLNTHRGWLLIFDNVENQTLLTPFVPSAPHGALLFTTRLPTLGTLAPCLNLSPLSVEESVQLLLSRARGLAPSSQRLSVGEESAAQTIAEALDGLPLALEQAAAYIEESQCGFVGFLSLLQHHALQVLQEHPVSMTYPRSVEQTFILAFERLRQQNQGAAEVLTLCCFLAPDEIPEALLKQGVFIFDENLQAVLSDPFQLQAAFKDLLTYALLYRNAQTRMLHVHRLVQTVLKAHLSEAVQQAWVQRLIYLLDQVFLIKPTRLETENWSWCEQLLPHAQSVLQENERFQLAFPELGSLVQKIGSYLFQRQRYEQAERFYSMALQVQEQVSGRDDPDLAFTMASLARTLQFRTCYQQVEQLYQQAIALLEAQVGAEDPRLVFPLRGLASFCTSMARYDEAEALYQRALHICTQQDDHLDTATTLHDLAVCYCAQGKYAQAELLYRRALQIRESRLPPSHPDIAVLLNDLASLYFRQASYQKAEEMYLRCLSLYEETIGSQRTEVATTLGNLAWLYHLQDKYELAEQLYQRELALYEQVVGPDDILVAHALTHLAMLYNYWGKYDEAETHATRSLSIYERSLPSDHHELSYPLHTLALLACQQGNNQRARAFCSRALAIREQKLPATHVDLAFSLHLLANISLAQGSVQEAEELFQRALDVYQKALGADHLDVALLEGHFAMLLQSQGRWEEAEERYEKALHIWEKFQEFHHAVHISCLERYARLLKQQQRGEEADYYDSHAQALRSRRQAAPQVVTQALQVLSETPESKKAFLPGEELDLFDLFLQERCVLSAQASCPTSDLWHAYQSWIQTQEHALSLSRRAFTLQLEAKNCQRGRTNKQRIWLGIRLKNLVVVCS